jgi:hypothetical protein
MRARRSCSGSEGIYVCFGRGLGWMEMPPFSNNWQLIDVHGAGAQRSDPKDGDPKQFPHGRGPQGDDVRILNFVRCVRGGISATFRGDRYTLPVATGGRVGTHAGCWVLRARSALI